MRDTLKVLVVGAGYFSRLQQDAWAADPRTRLVGIADTDSERARAAAGRLGTTPFPSLETAITEAKPDIVDIATPPLSHLDLVRTSVGHGRFTICQKPLCGGLEGARAAVALANAAQVPLVVHENFRFQPWYRAIRALLDDGALGTSYQLTFRLRPGDGQGADAYERRQPYFRTMERFLVHETGVHHVDVARYLFGEPDWVWADLRRLNPSIRGEDAGIFVLGYGDGRRVVFDGNRLADHAAPDLRRTMGETRLEGSKSTVDLDGTGTLTLRRFGERTVEAVDLGPVDDTFGGGCVARFQCHVVDHLLDGAPLENGAHLYLRNLEIVEAIYRSDREGRRIELGRADGTARPEGQGR